MLRDAHVRTLAACSASNPIDRDSRTTARHCWRRLLSRKSIQAVTCMALAMVLQAPPLFAQPSTDRPVRLHSRVIKPTTGVDADLQRQLTAAGDKRLHGIIKFNDWFTLDERRRLERRGIQLLDPLPERAYFVSASANAVRTPRALGLGRPERHAENVAVNVQFDAGEAIYIDRDDSGTVSGGDVLLSGPLQLAGTALVNFVANERHNETGSQGTYQAAEGAYRDVDTSRAIRVGPSPAPRRPRAIQQCPP